MKNRKITKAALIFSMALLCVWLLLGTTSSIAWFKDDDTLVNALHFGDMDIRLYYKNAGQYEEVDEATKIFQDDALYEPGFTQVTYLKVENSGTVPFSFDLSVVPDMASTVVATGVLGNQIDLADYIYFGLVTGTTEEEVMQQTASRDTIAQQAVHLLSSYTEDGGTLSPGETAYAAIVLHMPEEVGNVANYRGDTPPSVTLGIAAIANQIP